MFALSRLPAVVKSRGVNGLVRLAYRRLIHQRWTSKVYRDAVSKPRWPSQWPAGYRFEFCDRAAALPAETLAALAAAGAAEVVAMLDRDDQLYCVWHGEEIAAYGAVFVRSPQKSILGLPDNAILIGDCFTYPAHRRRGLYRLALNAVARYLRERGCGVAYVEVSPRNVASIRGIVRAGFADDGLRTSEIWLRFFVRQNGAWRRIHRESEIRPVASRSQPSAVSTELSGVRIVPSSSGFNPRRSLSVGDRS